jgi:hypothetical protein
MTTTRQHPGSGRLYRGDEWLEWDLGATGWFRIRAEHAFRLFEGRLVTLLPDGSYALVGQPHSEFRRLLRAMRFR